MSKIEIPPVDAQSVPFDQLPEAIQRDIEDALRRGQEYSKRMRQIVVAEATGKTTDRPVIKQFSDLFSETIAAVKLSDPTLTHDEAFARSWEQARFAAHTVRLSDPSTDPTPMAPAQAEQYAALDQLKVESDVTYQQRVAQTNKPRAELPPLNKNYQAALALIAQSPDMTRDAALKLARDAMAKDRAELIARNAAASNPSPPGGLAGTVL